MSDVKKVNILSIDVFKTKIHGINNQRLLKEIFESTNDIDDSFTKNKYHTYYEDKRYPFGSAESEKLINKLTEEVSGALNKEMVLSSIWTLTLGYGQSVSAHSHKSNIQLRPEEYFSIAYYPSAPKGSADLIFTVNAGNTIEKSVELTPETGDLIIFNSYLMHMTNRHNNKEELRVVVSANFSPKYPDLTPTQDWSAYARNPEDSEIIYDKRYSLTIQTPFGKEDATLGIKGNIAEIFNPTGKYFIEEFTETENSFIAEFLVDVPMVAKVGIHLSFDKDRAIEGYVVIGEFAKCPVSGVVL
jgi:hypothetical protein